MHRKLSVSNNNQHTYAMKKNRSIHFSTDKLLPCLAASLLLAGCAAPLPKNADMVHGGQTIVVVSKVAPKADLYRVGAQGLLDIAINHAVTSTLAGRMQSLDVPNGDELRDQVAQVLISKGYKVSVESTPIDLKTLPKFDGTQTHRTSGDWRAWGEARHADYVLLVSLADFGAARSYYGFIPTSKPYPVGDMVVEMIDPKTNTEVWMDSITSGADQVEDWDKPPRYEALSDRIAKKYDDNAHALTGVVTKDFPSLVTAATGSLSTQNASAAPGTVSASIANHSTSK